MNSLIYSQVPRTDNLKAGISLAQEDPRNTVLVTLGFRQDEIHEHLRPAGGSQRLEVVSVVTKPETRTRQPSASLLRFPPFFAAAANPVPHVRKSALRLIVLTNAHLREISTDDDLSQYFSLRYRVWREMGYLLPENDCPTSQWEASYSDRTAFPIGLFSQEEKLLACARLVRVYGRENQTLMPRICTLIDGRNDPCLKRAFNTHPPIPHPFDLLEAFNGFRPYYRECVRHNIEKAEVSRVVVDPDFRNKFYGEVIVDSLVTLARHKSIAALFLACIEKHERFYGRCGFRRIPDLHCESFPGVGARAIAMEQDLAQR